jgi:hypothetical protein
MATVTFKFYEPTVSTGGRVKYWYIDINNPRHKAFWEKKSPGILHAIRHQLPKPKYLLDAVSMDTAKAPGFHNIIQTDTDYGNGYKTKKYSRS